MKHYYIGSIIRQIFSSKRENIIVMFLMILICTLLTISNVISESEQLEHSLIQTANFDIQIVNDNIYSDRQNHEYEAYKSFYASGKNYLLSFVDGLDDLAKRKEVTYYNYNLICPAILNIDGDFLNTKSLIGINDENFIVKRKVNIVKGRMLSKKEIDDGENKVVIPNNIKGYEIGDTIKIFKSNDVDEKIKYSSEEVEEIFEVEIVGIYEADNSQKQFADKYDYFDNYSYILIPNNTMKNIISNNYTNIYSILLNDVTFRVDNYEEYVSFYNKYKELLIKNESDIKILLDGKPTDIHNRQQNYEYILYSIQRIKLYYNIVFVVMSIISIAILTWLNYYLLSNKIKEINIFYSLGEGKRRLMIRYVLIYIFILLISLVIGLLIGNGLSQMLQGRIFDNYIQTEKELLAYEIQNGISRNELVNLSFTSGIKIMVNVSIQAIFSTVISVVIVMSVILKGNLRDKLQKGI